MAVTLKQIAKYTGLSIPTVSDVINDKGALYRPETRERVLSAARELGYRPNAAARTMTSGRFGSVALLLSTKPHFSYLPNEMLQSVHDELAAHNLNLMLSKLSDSELTSEQFVPTVLKQWMVDGLLINYINEIPEALMNMVYRFRLASVWINFKREQDSVYVDDLASAELATAALIKRGHKKIAYAHFSQSEREALTLGHYSSRDRHAGYALAMRAAGLSPRAIFGSDSLSYRDWGVHAAGELAKEDRPTAILTYSAGEALGFAAAARNIGLRIPHDLAIIAFSEQPVIEPGLALTTMVLPLREIGRASASMLLKKISDTSSTTKSCAIAAQLVEGD